MCLRWTAAGMLEAETRFRKVKGYRGLANLAVEIEHDLLRSRQPDTHTSTQETKTASLCNHEPGPPPPLNFHGARDNLPLGTTRGSDEPAAALAGRFRFDPAERDRSLGLDMLIACR